jgi:hypothetical protein
MGWEIMFPVYKAGEDPAAISLIGARKILQSV